MIKRVNNIDGWTIVSMKLAIIVFVIIVLKLWGDAMTWIHDTNIWWFIGAFAVFVLRAGVGCEYCCGKFAKKVVKKKK